MPSSIDGSESIKPCEVKLHRYTISQAKLIPKVVQSIESDSVPRMDSTEKTVDSAENNNEEDVNRSKVCSIPTTKLSRKCASTNPHIMRSGLTKTAESIKPYPAKMARNIIGKGKVTPKVVRTIRRNTEIPAIILPTRNKPNTGFEPIQQPECTRKKCKFCAYSSFKKFNMTKHVICFHDKIKAIKCNRCLFSTSSNSRLVQHQKRVHDGKTDIRLKIKDKPCRYCAFSSWENTDLEMHIKCVHDKVQDVKCSNCLYTTSLKKHLVQHQKAIHQKLRNFVCTECPFMSTQASSLEAHQRSVHKKMKDYACSECPYTASTASHLKSHVIRRHGNRRITKYSCSFCHYFGFEKAHLDNHVKSKHDEIKVIGMRSMPS